MNWIKKVWQRIALDIRQYYMVVMVFLIYYVIVHLLYGTYCPMIVVTGFPCAGCGMTRAIFFALTGQLARSWYMNPLGILFAAYLIYCGICRYLLGTRIKGFMVAVVVGVIALLVCYVWRMYLYFPNRVPYVYTARNALAEHVPFYKDYVSRLLGMISR